MSMMSPPGGKPVEVGETVASFRDYEAAAKAVSRLIAAEVPARDIAIVGRGLRSVEKITGKLGYATAARSGAINGILLGLLFATIMVLGSPEVPIQLFVGVMFVGIAFGMILSLISYAIVRRRRDFASVMQVVADHYDVAVAATSMHRARQALSGAGAAPVAPAPSAPVHAPPSASPIDAAPPRYGERIVPAAAPVAPTEGVQTPASAPATPSSAPATPSSAPAAPLSDPATPTAAGQSPASAGQDAPPAAAAPAEPTEGEEPRA